MDELLIKFLSAYFNSEIRGSTRLTNFLSNRFSRFHAIPIKTNKGTVIADLRSSLHRNLLTYREGVTDEEIVMRKFIRPGDVSFDIGVYLGIYTALMSDLVGRTGAVHSFEPNPSLIPSLRNTAAYLGNVTLHEYALSDSEGEVVFFVPRIDASKSSLVDWTEGTGGIVDRFVCQKVSLDQLLAKGQISPPSFIKCDVEGAEIGVLRGATELLNSENAPIVFFEVNPVATIAFGAEPDCCFHYLESFTRPKYKFFQVVDHKLVPLDDFGGLILNVYGFTNAVAVPAARMLGAEGTGE